MPRKTRQEQGGVEPTRKSERSAEVYAPPSTVVETTPDEVLDRSDPGDAVQRNFRYQHAYGVILLIGAATGRLPYVAIWCEHHEDILAERADGKWDGYQIKTRQREAGDWLLGDEELCNGIKHLATMDGRFPGRIESLHIVSNARFLDTQSTKQMHRSPVQFLHAVSAAPAPGNLKAPFDLALSKLPPDSC